MSAVPRMKLTTPKTKAMPLHSSAMRVEPSHHDAVEGLWMLDIGEMPGVRDLLVAAAGDELGDALVAGGRRPLVIGAADDQGRDLHRGQFRHEIEIEDRPGATEKSRRRRAADGGMDLLPPAGIA